MGAVAIWSSPYIRAQQTAGIAAEVLGVTAGVSRTLSELTPEGAPRAVIDEVYRSDLDALLLVSHQPLVSRLLDVLCGSSAQHEMKTASLACVDCDVVAADLGHLQWLVHP